MYTEVFGEKYSNIWFIFIYFFVGLSAFTKCFWGNFKMVRDILGIVTKPICDSLYLWYKRKAVSPVFPVSWKEMRQGPYPLQLWIRRDYSCHSKPPTDGHAHCCHTPNLLNTICVLMCHSESVPVFLSPWAHSSVNSSRESVCVLTPYQQMVRVQLRAQWGKLSHARKHVVKECLLCSTCVRGSSIWNE